MKVRARADTFVALALLAVHAIAVWGHIGVFWGDVGRWSHEVERFALGELPYRDFQWHYPPLGLWIEGMAAAAFGTDRMQLSLITTALAAVVVVAAAAYSSAVTQRVDKLQLSVALVLAFTYAQAAGAPLPLGLYSPAALVGALFMVIAAVFFVKSISGSPGRAPEWAGASAALAVLSKQDFWLPALFVLAVTAWRVRRIMPVVVFGVIVAFGVALVVATAGVDVLLPLVGGFGHATLAGGMGFPSWERLTVELFVLSLIGAAVALLVSYAQGKLLLKPLFAAGGVAILAAAIHLAVSMNTTLPEAGALLSRTQDRLAYHIREGNSLVRPALGWLRERTLSNPIPVLLPLLLLAVVVWRWSKLAATQRTMMALLLGLAIALRARRAFLGTEWFEFLITLPIVLLTAEVLLALPAPQLRRFRAATIGLLAVVAIVTYAALGRGPGTARYYPDDTATLRGTIHVKPGEALQYRKVLAALDSVDSARQRPLFAFGFTGGFNYFMKRRNPFPFTQDFFFSAFNADSVLRERPRELLLIDNRALAQSNFVAAGFEWRAWEQAPVPAPYNTYDRIRFDRLKEGCPLIADVGLLLVYSCP